VNQSVGWLKGISFGLSVACSLPLWWGKR